MSQKQLNPFKPTALLVMEHNITGMKYFCKTTCVDRVKTYKGSGIAWNKHLEENGKDITVGLLGFYVDEERCLSAAKKFSEDNDIVRSQLWANAIPETGRNGVSLPGELNPFYGKKHTPETAERLRLKKIGRSVNKGAYRSPEQRAKISEALKGRKNPHVAEKLRGRKLSEETRNKISEAGKGRKLSMESREKIRQASLAQWERYRQNKLTPDSQE
jgi:hypothetical protein